MRSNVTGLCSRINDEIALNTDGETVQNQELFIHVTYNDIQHNTIQMNAPCILC